MENMRQFAPEPLEYFDVKVGKRRDGRRADAHREGFLRGVAPAPFGGLRVVRQARGIGSIIKFFNGLLDFSRALPRGFRM